MAIRIDLTFDCHNASLLAEFWKLALGYEDEPPPAPFATRQAWVDSFGEPEEAWDDGAWLHDPDGIGPRLSFLGVPEPKVAKNRLHLDVRVAGSGTPEQRWARIEAKAEQLLSAGASVVAYAAGHHAVLADPEGNEFCVC